MYDLVFSKAIDSDFDRCYKYIAETLEAPMAAENLFKELYEKINSILKNPFRRSFVQNKYLASLGIRSINVKNYILFYTVTEENNSVNTVRFMYNKRDWVNILKDESLEELF